MAAKAAPAHFPYDHRTVAEIDAERVWNKSEFDGLDWISRRRPLSYAESVRMASLIKRIDGE